MHPSPLTQPLLLATPTSALSLRPPCSFVAPSHCSSLVCSKAFPLQDTTIFPHLLVHHSPFVRNEATPMNLLDQANMSEQLINRLHTASFDPLSGILSNTHVAENESPRMSDSGNTTTQCAQSTEGNAPPPPSNTKYSIFIDVGGAKGKDAAKWSSCCGVLICIHILIGYEEWRKVDDFYKDNLWNAIVALIIAAEERQKSETSITSGEGIKGLEEFENDPIAEVFGDEKGRSYCRAISSTANAKRVKLTQASKAIVNFKENEDKQWKTEMQNNQNQVNETIKSMNLAILSMDQTMQQFISRIGGNITRRVECDSHAERASNDNVTSLDFGIESSIRAKQLVSLLSRDEVEVGRGHLETRGICHDRKVLREEKVVWVHEVLDPEVPIFEAPHDGNYTLSDIADGGFIIWPEYRKRYLNGNKEN